MSTAVATRRVDTWESFEARRTQVAKRIKAGLKLGIWQALDLFGASADLRIKDLTARIETLEQRLGVEPGVTARASAKRETLRLSVIGDIRKDRVQGLIDRVKAADPETPIKLTVDSKGGLLDPALDLADVLSRHKGAVHVHALSDCSSAAVALMLSGTKRTAEANCSFVLHRPSLARRPTAFLAANERIEGALDNSAHGMATLLSRRTGKDADVFKPFLATVRGKRLTSAEAVELGIIHGLRPIKGRKAKK